MNIQDFGLDAFVFAPDAVEMTRYDICSVVSLPVDELQIAMAEVTKRLSRKEAPKRLRRVGGRQTKLERQRYSLDVNATRMRQLQQVS